MQLFFQIVGVVVVVFVLLAVVAVLYLRIKLRQLGKALGDAVPQPTSIDLEVISADSWLDPGVTESVAGFESLGYTRGSAYRPREIPQLIVLPLVNTAQSTYGVIYNMGGKVWSDVVQRYENGSVTVSNSTLSAGLKQRPDYENIYFPSVSIAELQQRFHEKRPSKAALPATFEGFKSEFEEAYASEMAWRDATAVTAEEIQAVARKSGNELTAEELALAEDAVSRQRNDRLRERLYAEFLRTTTVSAAEWESIQDRLAFIHDRLSPDELAEIAQMAFEDEDEEVEIRMPPGAPRVAFAAYNTTLAPSRQFRLLGVVTSAIEADAYAAPAEVYAE